MASERISPSRRSLAAQVELGGGDVDTGGADDLDGLVGHLRADAVADDHCDVAVIRR